MAVRYNSSVTNSRPALTPKQTVSLDSLRRNSRSQLNRSIKLEKKIYGAKNPPKIVESFVLWEFNDPVGNDVVVDYTFSFADELRVDDFGDGTNATGIKSGVTFTKTYS